MIMRRQAQVSMVTSEAHGAVAVAWAGTSLQVINAADFGRDGGRFTIPGSMAIYTFTGVVEGEDEIDVVETMETAPVGFVPDTRVSIWPEAVDVTAHVELEGTSDVVPAVVPHSLRPLLRDGARDAADREWVEIDIVADQWQVVDVVGRAPVIDAAVIESDGARLPEILEGMRGDIEGASLDGSVTYSASAPSPLTTDAPEGSRWVQNVGGVATAVWESDGTSWMPQPMPERPLFVPRIDIGSGTFGQLDGQRIIANTIAAEDIAAGDLSGFSIYSPSKTATPRTQIVGPTLSVIRSDGETEYSALSIGSPTDADQMMLYGADGNPLAGFDESGTGITQRLVANEGITLAGEDLANVVLYRLPQGIVARQRVGSSTPLNGIKFGTTELGLFEVTWTGQPGRQYRVCWEGMLNGTAGGVAMRMRYTSSTGSAAVPGITSPQFAQGNFTISGNTTTGFGGYIFTPSATLEIRVLLTAQHLGGSGANAGISAGDTFPGNLTVYDEGTYTGISDGSVNLGGGTAYTGGGTAPTPPTVAKRSYVTVWPANWDRSWRGGSLVTDALHQGRYDGLQRYSMLGFTGANSQHGSTSGGGEVGKTVVQALTGATDVQLFVELTALSWYDGRGGYALIGTHGNNTAPGSPQTTGGGAFAYGNGGSGRWTKNTTQQVRLPDGGKYAQWAAGTIDGITLGETSPTSGDYYGKFSRTARLIARYNR